MASTRQSIPRKFANDAEVIDVGGSPISYDAPRLVRRTVVDFGSLGLPVDVARALAEAFWCHFGAMARHDFSTHWHHIKVFARFVRESAAVTGLADIHSGMLLRYIEWLNAQRGPDGQPWTKGTRAGTYLTLRKMLQWLERYRPGVIACIEYPFNPFPWRNRDAQPSTKMRATELRVLLRACETDIARIRADREAAAAQRIANAGEPGTLGWLLDHIDRCGVLPHTHDLRRPGQYALRSALYRLGGRRQVEPYLYPRAESLLPYYLAIMVHAAGNPEPIAELGRNCLQSLPLLEDRQALVWFKPRANSTQRLTFDNADPFGPPALVKEILSWNDRLRPLAPICMRDRLFLYQGHYGVMALTSDAVKKMIKPFCERHRLPIFTLVSIRPGVLASFYRVSGDLRRVKAIANHAHLSTTVRYVQTPEVEAQHRIRIAALQQAFIGHIVQVRSNSASERVSSKPACNKSSVPTGEVVSMFGFNCTDPFAGVAAGTRPGELCTNFMGCFTCPNAIITPDPSTLARLIQARDHIRAASAVLHPARWQSIYAPQLQILEEDILPRFSAAELAAAHSLVAQLPPLPDLR
ncbi:hypothetical protein [Paraburkholderia largidicola]|uniref:hypothetical protein n=1 Tax=Paraburkholderia largidicola TaxID=3014751 RepID=UPI0015DAF4B9|nr:hypothetical protein [Paraburkholderia sp. PGU16]